jgi:HEAT repeat protein
MGSLEDLVRQAGSDDQLRASDAIFRLGESRDPRVLDALASILGTGNGLAKIEAARALAKFGNSAIPNLESIVATSSDENAVTLATAILKLLRAGSKKKKWRLFRK